MKIGRNRFLPRRKLRKKLTLIWSDSKKWWNFSPYRFAQRQNHFRWSFAVHIEMRIHQFARNYWHTLQRTGERKFAYNTNVNLRIQIRARRRFVMAGIIINVVDGICAAVATIAIWNRKKKNRIEPIENDFRTRRTFPYWLGIVEIWLDAHASGTVNRIWCHRIHWPLPGPSQSIRTSSNPTDRPLIRRSCEWSNGMWPCRIANDRTANALLDAMAFEISWSPKSARHPTCLDHLRSMFRSIFSRDIENWR